MNSTVDLILASNSPRRQALLREAGFDFIIRTMQVNEDFGEKMKVREVAKFLSKKKNQAYRKEFPHATIITADTTVIQKDKVLNKPEDRSDAFQMIRSLSGTFHEVITGVTISSPDRSFSFDEATRVYFRELTDREIDFYIDHYQPFDKAGAYGIQEWIGMIGIEKIEGNYYNVMGLPIQKVYDVLAGRFSITPGM